MKQWLSVKAFQEEELHDVEGVRLKRSGERVNVGISTALLRDPDGEPAGMIAIYADITERTLAAEELRKSHEKYAGLVNSISGIVWERDVESFRFTFVSRRVEEILGYPADTWLAEPGSWENSIHADDRQWVIDSCRPENLVGASHEFEYRAIAANGRIVWLRNSFVVVAEEGRSVKLRGVMTDISRRKGAEEELSRLNGELEQRVAQRTSELEAVNRELEAFSYSVSHDLRAPLRHMAGLGKILLEDYHDQFDAMGQLHLIRLCSAAKRMGQLIDDLLKLAMVGKGEISRETTDLSSLARDIAHDLVQSQPERAVAFTISEGVRAQGDPRLLRVVMENLLANAWKYTGMCSDAVIEFGVVEKGGRPVYFVRDNGVGFDNRHAEEIFKPFTRLHGEREFEGTGIGLATVQRVIARHGGVVWADGGLGGGAVFYFMLS